MDRELTIDLLRHGETEAGKRFIGSTNALLTAKGQSQMQWVERRNYRQVYSSPLLRCAEFARALSLSPVMLDELRELDFGEWENRSSDEIWREDRDRLAAFWNDPFENTPPGGEALSSFVARVEAGWRQLIEDAGEGACLLISHGGVIRVILSLVLGFPLTNLQRLHIDHGGLSRIEVSRSGLEQYYRVVFINRLPPQEP